MSHRSKLIALIVTLVALLGSSLAQAQTLPAPTGLHLLEFDQGFDYSNRALLKWDSVEGAADYEVFIKGPSEWSTKNTGAWRTADFPEAQQHLFFDLERGATYYFRVRAVDGDGAPGEKSRRIDLKVPPAATEPNVDKVTSDSVELSWAPVKNRNGRATKIKIDGLYSQLSHISMTGPGKASITGLQPDSEYTIVLIHYLPRYRFASGGIITVRTLPAPDESA